MAIAAVSAATERKETTPREYPLSASVTATTPRAPIDLERLDENGLAELDGLIRVIERDLAEPHVAGFDETIAVLERELVAFRAIRSRSGGLPLELRLQVRAAVESTTE